MIRPIENLLYQKTNEKSSLLCGYTNKKIFIWIKIYQRLRSNNSIIPKIKTLEKIENLFANSQISVNIVRLRLYLDIMNYQILIADILFTI